MATDRLTQLISQDSKQNALSSPNIQIIRSPHKKNYSVIANVALEDDRLSHTALVILMNRIKKPDNWKLIPKVLAKELKRSVCTIYKHLNQLIDLGYLVRRLLKNAHGQYAGYYYVLVEEGQQVNLDLFPGKEDEKSEGCKPRGYKKHKKTDSGFSTLEKQLHIINTDSNKYRSKQIQDLSPTPHFKIEEEIDFWSDSYSDSSQVEPTPTTLEPEPSNINRHQAEQNKNPCTATISSIDKCSAAEKTSVSAIKPTRKERRSARQNNTWVEFGQRNGLWDSLEELQGFMAALYAHAVNNPRLHTPSKWVESEVQKTCDRGTGTHWTEYVAGLQVGTIDQKPWADVHGNVNLSFRSYIEQSKFGESGNSTARAVELAAQVLADPFKAGLLWNEYQRRLEREVAEKARYELMGVTYDAPTALKPKPLVSAEATAQTQQLLRIDDASQVCQPVMEPFGSVLALEAEVESSESTVVGEAPWDMIAAKMLALEEKMSISQSRSQPQVTPLSDVYREPKPVDQVEAVEFKAWYDLVKAAGLVEYSYRDPRCHAVVVLVGGEALPWRDARDLLGGG